MSVFAFIGVGSNRGNRLKNIERAIQLMNEHKGIRLTDISPLYKTSPVGPVPQRDFYNGIVKARVTLKPSALLKALKSIEKGMGRVKKIRWGPRVIDLDLVAYGRLRFQAPRLTVPHPHYHERRFVLKPFSDMAPDFIHPVLRRSNRVLLRQLTVKDQRVTMEARWNGTRFCLSKTSKKAKPRSSR